MTAVESRRTQRPQLTVDQPAKKSLTPDILFTNNGHTEYGSLYYAFVFRQQALLDGGMSDAKQKEMQVETNSYAKKLGIGAEESERLQAVKDYIKVRESFFEKVTRGSNPTTVYSR